MNTFSNKQLLYDLFQAYFDARRNKRNTINALAFEINYERKLFELYEELKNETYQVGPSICFIILKPVKREVFAADFRDRVVHHLIYNYISPIFEKLFIYDSYSCREEKGTSCGIKRLGHFIRSCSQNYRYDCHILKLDIKSYFMSIDRNILYQKVEKTLQRFKNEVNFDMDFILRLIRKVIFNDSTKNCLIKGKRENWQGLPKTKSLFFVKENKGLPIGNLTSQLFGNVYLNDFDHFAKYQLGIKRYGRYVDDIVIVHKEKEYLKFIVPVLRDYLAKNFFLELHENKIYFQHFTKGVNFLGTIIKPWRIYIQKRTKGNFYEKIQFWNNLLNQEIAVTAKGIGGKDMKKFLSSVNSYLGIMKHYNTYNLRKKILTKNLSKDFSNYIYIKDNYDRIAPKN